MSWNCTAYFSDARALLLTERVIVVCVCTLHMHVRLIVDWIIVQHFQKHLKWLIFHRRHIHLGLARDIAYTYGKRHGILFKFLMGLIIWNYNIVLVLAFNFIIQFLDYQTVAEGYGGTGYKMTNETPAEMVEIFKKAKADCKAGKPVLINCFIGKTDFRAGSISVWGGGLRERERGRVGMLIGR